MERREKIYGVACAVAVVTWLGFTASYYDWSPQGATTETTAEPLDNPLCGALIKSVNLIGVPGDTLQEIATRNPDFSPLELIDQSVSDISAALREAPTSGSEELHQTTLDARDTIHEDRIDITANLNAGDFAGANDRFQEAQEALQGALDGNCGP